MAYLEIFERVTEHVSGQGGKVTFKRGASLNRATITQLCARSIIPIPKSLAEFYAEIGDGLVFSWIGKTKGSPFANMEIPKLESCIVESRDKLKWRTEWIDDYPFSFTKNPALARQTAIKMRHWMPFLSEENGDEFCLDTSNDEAPVVFNRHDWYDGGSGENGHGVAPSLHQFFLDWSKVCFQFPTHFWWPGVLNKHGAGVNWTSDQFRDPFRLPLAG